MKIFDGEEHLCSIVFVFYFLFSILYGLDFLDHCKSHIVTYMDSKIGFCWGLFFDFYTWLILWILNI
jgi:hypothetical protein